MRRGHIAVTTTENRGLPAFPISDMLDAFTPIYRAFGVAWGLITRPGKRSLHDDVAADYAR
jgi:hypothetical protein